MGVVYPELPPIQWPQNRDCFLLGLTGGIGSGKSAAARCFEQAGAIVADADQIAKEVLHSEAMRSSLRAEFGDGIFGPDGVVSRPAIAELVFGHPERLQRLNALIHPAVREQFLRRQATVAAGGMLVYDIPLLFESGQQDQFDLTMVVTAPLDLRYERVQARNGWSRDEFERREAAQMPLREKAERADFILENQGTERELAAAVQTVYAKIVQRR